MGNNSDDQGDVSQASAPTGAVVGSPRNDGIVLPKFIVRAADGYYILLTALDSPGALNEFVDRTYTAGMVFTKLDYACLQNFLYNTTPAEIVQLAKNLQAQAKPPAIRFAAGIAPFHPERRPCYRNIKMIEDGAASQYLFETVYLERSGQKEPEKVTLDIDEFIAAMWRQNVRYGIDVAAVIKAINSNINERVIVARMLLPTKGCDASVMELSSTLHRDNTPKLLPDGRVDLHQFSNRFPQVTKDMRLLKKIHRILGKSGRDIAGHELFCEIPRDLDLELLAGVGTRFERNADGEFIISNISGFVLIDAKSSNFSISEKIINTEGVSSRTTGNLALSGEDYEEHGEVGEHAQVDGKNMTFKADVFGNIVSHGGKVVLKSNLSAGFVKNPGGIVIVEGNTSRENIEAIGGEIILQNAESCHIVGKKVTIKSAVNCDIIADELNIENAEGCAMAAQIMRVGISKARRDVETTISMLLPDSSGFEKQLEGLRQKQAEAAKALEAKTAEINTLTLHADVKNYFFLNAKITAKEINMSPEQTANWQKLVIRVQPMLKQLKPINDALRALQVTHDGLMVKIQSVINECDALAINIECKVDTIAGDTIIRTLKTHTEKPLQTMPAREVHTRLRESSIDVSSLFSGDEGSFEWKYSKPEN